MHIIKCPACKQKLALQEYIIEGTLVVCGNKTCLASLRVASRRPLRVEVVPKIETHSVDYRPESYG